MRAPLALVVALALAFGASAAPLETRSATPILSAGHVDAGVVAIVEPAAAKAPSLKAHGSLALPRRARALRLVAASLLATAPVVDDEERPHSEGLRFFLSSSPTRAGPALPSPSRQ